MNTTIIDAAAPDRPRSGAVTVGVVGDSISAGTPAWDPNPLVRARITDPDPTSTWEHWASQQTGVRFAVTAVDGERTDQIAERLDLLWGEAEAIVVQGGINDIVQGRDPLEAADRLAAIVDRVREKEIPVALVDVLPWNLGKPEHVTAIDRLNDRLRQHADERGVPVLPFFEVLSDPESPGRMGREWTADGSHPNVVGHRRLGELAFRAPSEW